MIFCEEDGLFIIALYSVAVRDCNFAENARITRSDNQTFSTILGKLNGIIRRMIGG